MLQEVNSADILSRLQQLHPKVIDLSLDRIKSLLNKLGNPQDNLPPAIHVAGTNGKGSTIAFMRGILEANGYKVHGYISPHLVRFNERIRLSGELISDAYLTDLLQEVERVNGGEPITFFEITTVVAFLAFSRIKADFLLLETGLGGRLDATNVIKSPIATVITPISLDHESYLGDTIAQIAYEKACIMKQGSVCILAPQEAEAQAVFRDYAIKIGSELLEYGKNWGVNIASNQAINHFYNGVSAEYPRPSLKGNHQAYNLGLALTALKTIRERNNNINLDISNTCKAIKEVSWAGRLQKIEKGLLYNILDKSTELFIDGGHNPGAGEVLEPILREWAAEKPLYVICGMLKTKDAGGFLRHVVNFSKEIYTVEVPHNEVSFSAQELAEISSKTAPHKPVKAFKNVKEALAALSSCKNARILICGSLYLLGSFLGENQTFPE